MTMYHCSIDLNYILRRTPKEAATMLRDADSGRRLRSEEVYAMATTLKAQGFDVLPTCDHHDERGNCLGHDGPSRTFARIIATHFRGRVARNSSGFEMNASPAREG